MDEDVKLSIENEFWNKAQKRVLVLLTALMVTVAISNYFEKRSANQTAIAVEQLKLEQMKVDAERRVAEQKLMFGR